MNAGCGIRRTPRRFRDGAWSAFHPAIGVSSFESDDYVASSDTARAGGAAS